MNNHWGIHPDMVKRLRQYGSFLNQFYILNFGQEVETGTQLCLPSAPTLEEAFVLGWHKR